MFWTGFSKTVKPQIILESVKVGDVFPSHMVSVSRLGAIAIEEQSVVCQRDMSELMYLCSTSRG